MWLIVITIIIIVAGFLIINSPAATNAVVAAAPVTAEITQATAKVVYKQASGDVLPNPTFIGPDWNLLRWNYDYKTMLSTWIITEDRWTFNPAKNMPVDMLYTVYFNDKIAASGVLSKNQSLTVDRIYQKVS